MAERRMIHRKISWSRQFNEMSEFAQLLFLMMIPHADDWGSMTADPYVIKAQVIPMNSWKTPEDVGSALKEMESCRLIWIYQPDGEEPLLQFRKWEEHQTGLHKRTRPKTKLYFYCEEAQEKLEEAGISWNYREFHGISPRTEGTEQNKEEKGTNEENESALLQELLPPSNSNVKWWQFIQAMEQVQGSRDTVSQWFTHGRIAEVTDEYVLIQIPNPRYAEFINDRAMHRVQQAVDSLWDGNREARLEAMPPT